MMLGHIYTLLFSWSYFAVHTVSAESEDPSPSQVPSQLRYRFKIDAYTKCSLPCGGGTQRAIFVCYDTIIKSVVTTSKCSFLGPPGIYRRVCNITPCQYRWFSSKWGPCSKTCGQGIQYRSTRKCVNRHKQRVSAWKCARLKRPRRKKKCAQMDCRAEWVVGHWSECSVSCGEGVKRRSVDCQQAFDNGTTASVALSQCPGLNPPLMVKCIGRKCDPLPTDAYYDTTSGAGQTYDIQGDLPLDQEPDFVSEASGPSGGGETKTNKTGSVQDRPKIILAKKDEYVLRKRGKLTVTVGTTVWSVKGSEITVICRTASDSKARIEWETEDGYEVLNFFEDDVGLDDEGNLKIRDVGRFNEGTYKCKATNAKGASSVATFTLQIIVLNAPTILSVKSSNSFGPRDAKVTVTVGGSVTVYKGTTVTIKCPVIGKPKPYVYWYSQGRPISVGKAVTIGNNLVIRNIDKIYALEYTCFARNFRARAKAATTVRVLDLARPKIAAKLMVINIDETKPKMSIRIGTNLTVIAGSSVTIHCPVETKPESMISWRARGKKYEGKHARVKLRDNNSTMVLSQLRVVDTGVYVCRAENNAGRDEQVTYVKVAGPVKPRILSKKGFKSSLEGDQEMAITIGIQATVLSGIMLKIKCPAKGLPAPEIRWLVNDRAIWRSRRGFKIQGNTLTITKISKREEGWVSCVARNKVGQVKSNSKINVIAGLKPKIQGATGRVTGVQGLEEARITIGQDLRVVEGLNVRIRCPVVGFPKPVVSWSRNDEDVTPNRRIVLDEDSNDLFINRMQTSDTGQYVCSAVNPISEDRKSSFISIIGEFSAQILSGNKTLLTSINQKPVTMVVGRPLEVLSGTKIHITCPVKGTPSPFVSWRRAGKKIVTGEGKGKFVITKGRRGISTLTISGTDKDDEGSYECVATNLGGADRVATTITVIEARQPEIKFVSKRIDSIKDQSRVSATIGSLISMLAGANLSITCPASGVPEPTITWFINGKPVGKRRRVKLRGNEIFVKDVAAGNAGQYRCVAKNVLASASRSSDVNVLVPVKPQIKSPPDDLQMLEVFSMSVDAGNTITSIPGVSLELKCSARGLPTPKIQWRFGEIVVAGNKLKLPNVTIGDSRTYTCEAINLVGTDTQSTVLKVKAITPPVIHAGQESVTSVRGILPITTTIGDTVTALKGTRVTLVCHVSGFPPPRVLWSKDSRDVTGRVRQLRYNSTHHAAIIETKGLGDKSGEYACMATNKGGTVTALSSVSIKAATRPSIKSTWLIGSVGTVKSLHTNDPVTITIGDRVETLTGTEVSISCPVSGLPPPRVTWFKNRRRLWRGSKYSIINGTDLMIKSGKATRYDSGRYMCRASNYLGRDSAYSEVKFRAPTRPKILALKNNFKFTVNTTLTVTIGATVKVLRGSSVTLTCAGEGMPTPSITWRKGGAVLGKGNKYTVGPAKDSDAGQYECVASNVAGKASASSAITVHETFEKRIPPKILSTSKNLLTSENKRLFHHIIGGNITILEGRDLILQCPSIGSPKPVVSWFLNGSAVVESDTLTVDPDSGALSVIEITLEEQGQYTCVSKNIAGQDIKTSYTTVVGPVAPKITLSNKIYKSLYPTKKALKLLLGDALTTLSGTRTSISCPATGFPNPVIRWFRNGVAVAPGGNHWINDSQLVMTAPRKADTGVYLCVASNPGGDATGTSNITFIDPVAPNITTSKDDVYSMKRGIVTVRIGSDVTVINRATIKILCDAEGIPPPVFSWVRRNRKLRTRTRELWIRNVGRYDGGVVTCTARNAFGFATKRTRVTILSARRPRIKSSRNVVRDLTDFTTTTINIGDKAELLAGSNLTILCRATGIPKPSYIWLLNNIRQKPKQDAFVDAKAGTWIVIGTRTGDSGTYKCRARNLAGTNEAFSLVTVTAPRGPFIVSSDKAINQRSTRKPVRALIGSNITVLSGTQITVTCQSSGLPRPSTSWTQNGRPVRAVRLSRNKAQMRIGRTTPADSGVYACSASSPAGTLTKTSHISVIAGQKPVIARSTDPITDLRGRTTLKATVGSRISLLASSSLTLVCDVTGVPAPTVTWTIRGRPVVQNNRIRIDKTGRSMVFSRVQTGDAGAIVCTAKNIRGTDRVITELIVADPIAPKITTVKKVIAQLDSQNPVSTEIGTSITVLSGSTISIQCLAKGLPKPSVTWTLGGKPLTSQDHVTVTNQSLTIRNAGKDNSGFYMCWAVNMAGKDTASSAVNVKASNKARITSVGKSISSVKTTQPITANIGDNITALAGTILTISCPTEGLPLPATRWTKEGVPLAATKRVAIDKKSGELSIKAVRSSDSGVFTCVAKNLGGVDKKDTHLTVIDGERPRIKLSRNVVRDLTDFTTTTINIGDKAELLAGSNLTILCRASGIPKPHYIWLLNNIQQKPKPDVKAGTWIVIGARTANSGTYKCRARNLAGADEAFSLVTVTEPRGPFITSSHKTINTTNSHKPVRAVIGSNITILSDTPITLTCQSTGLPRPVTSWMHNGLPVKAVRLFKNKAEMRIARVNLGDAGYYACSASSPAGRVTVSSRMVVIDPIPPKITTAKKVIAQLDSQDPVITDIGRSISVLSGSTISIKCLVKGLPKPSIAWALDGIPLTSQKFVILTNQLLTIRNAGVDDSGAYTCSAVNTGGKDSVSSVVTVKAANKARITSVGKTVSFTTNNKPITANIGDNITALAGTALNISCPTEGLPRPATRWAKEGVPLAATNRVAIDQNSGKLSISTLRSSDSGIFTCVAENLGGVNKKDTHIKVIEPVAPSVDAAIKSIISLDDFSPITTNVGSSVTAFLGTNITIICKANGLPEPSITWARGGLELFDWITEEGRRSSYRGNLRIIKAVLDDAGIYLCTAKNLAGVASATSTLILQAPRGPFVETSKETKAVLNNTKPIQITIGVNLTTLVNTTITIRCQGTGTPVPSISWRRNGNVIISNHVKAKKMGTLLEIAGARLSDGGYYACVAESGAGRVSAVSRITVIAGLPPRIDKSDDVVSALTELTNLTVTVGSPVSVLAGSGLKLLCPAKAIPRPAVSWTVDGSDVVPDQRMVLERFQNALSIGDLVPRDSGSFTCTARNHLGQDVVSSWVSVLEPFGPTINSTGKVFVQLDRQDPISTQAGATITTLSGVTITVECKATGLPVAQVAWSLSGKPVKTSGRISVDNGTLTIGNAGSADGGMYECIATSSIGEDTVTTAITIQGSEKARITSAGRTKSEISDITSYEFNIGDNITVLAGSEVTITCPTEGLPKPSVSWMITRRPAPVSGEIPRSLPVAVERLTVRNVQVSDAGVYTCTARNLKGSDQMSSVLTILVPYGPSIESSSRKIVALKNLDPVSATIGDDVTALEKAPVTLLCKASGLPVPSVKWTKDGQLVSSHGHVIVNKGRLKLTASSLNDSAAYVCTASSALGNVTATSVVDIKAPVPPSIKTSDDIIESLKRTPLGLVIGQTARTLTRIVFNITCDSEGLPAPNITWKKDGVPLPVDGRMYARGHILFIAESLTRDSGVYICEASNIAGSKKAESSLKVFGQVVNLSALTMNAGAAKRAGLQVCANVAFLANFHAPEPAEPEITTTVQRLEQLRPVSITVEVGSYVRTLETSNVTLLCEVKGFPPPVITWRRGLTPLNNTQGTRRYRIGNAKERDSGIYTCVANNLVGYDFRSSNISVVAAEAPTIRVTKQPLNVLRRELVKTDIGKSVTTLSRNKITLVCNATGVPSPSLKWYKDNRPLDIAEMALTIESANLTDSGLYTCKAKNLKGEVSEESRLTILDGRPPVIRTSDKAIMKTSQIRYIVTDVGSNITTLLSSNIEIQCNASGFPKPKVTWFKDGQRIFEQSMTLNVDSTTGTLYLMSIVMRRQGRYKCEAANSLGTASAVSVINVNGLVFPRINVSRGVIKSIQSRNPVGIRIGQDLMVLSGTDVTIECPSHGIPVPKVTWKRGQVKVLSAGRVVVGDRFLRIRNVTRDDDGRYECYVQNVEGELSAGSNLKILDPVKPTIHNVPEILKIFLQQPIRTNIGSSITTIPGNSFTLTCNATGIPTPKLTWQRDNKQIQKGGAKYVIPAIKVSDSGKYSCVAKNLEGVARATSLVNSLVGDRPRITSKREHVIATAGENEAVVEAGGNLTTIVGTGVEITCPVTGEPVPMVTWLKNGTLVQTTSVLYVNRETQALTILGITEDDVGFYTCYANNSFGVDSAATLVRVIAARIPRIRFSRRRIEDYNKQSYEITVGDNLKTLVSTTVTIYCNASGNPQPKLTWTRSGGKIATGFRVKVTENSVFIRDALWSDTGNYECTATNGAGTDQRVSFLKFVPPERPAIDVNPAVVEAYDRSPVNIKVGTTLKTLTQTPISINCTATGIPTPTYTWTRLGETIKDGSKFSVTDDGRVLTIRDISIEDAGIYECKADNKAGADTGSAPILVQEPILPQITSTNENITWYDRLPISVSVGGKITALTGIKVKLTCQASGFPQPRVTWRRGDDVKELDPDGQYEISNQSLVIFSVQPSDTGLYKCTAGNLAGDVHAYTDLVVIDPKDPVIDASTQVIYTEDRTPVTITIGSRVTVLLGTPVSIKCPVQGIPTPTITWSNGGRFLVVSREKSTLEFAATTLSDTGEYMCTAMSPIGADAASSQLIVLPPQKPRITSPLTGRSIPLTKASEVTINIRDSVAVFRATVVYISCPVTGLPAPKVSFLKDSKQLTKGFYTNSTLRIVLSRLSDAGAYECVAENSEGRASATSDVTVLEPNYPTITSKSGLTTALDDRRPVAATIGMTVRTLTSTSITVRCPVQGSPKPTVEWSKGGNSVISGDRVLVSARGDLVILNSKISDSGRYACTARNLLGRDTASSFINIMRPSVPRIHHSTDYIVWWERRPFKSKIGNNLTTMKGRKLTLICPASGMPRPKVTWFRGGEEMRTEDNIVVKGDTLVLNDMTVFDTDRYTCVAENVAGSVDATTTLKVHDPVPPHIFSARGYLDALSGYTPVNVTIGQDASVPTDTLTVLTCPIQGVPRPKVVWISNEKIVEPDSVIEVGCNGTLKFHSIRLKDQGEYVCYTENFMGMDMAFTNIRVVPRSAPAMRKSNKTVTSEDMRPISVTVGDRVTALQGNTMSIKCQATGIPYPKISWTRNGIRIQSVGMYDIDGSGTLTVRGMRENGVLTCHASNDQGQDNATTVLTVIESKSPKILLSDAPQDIPLTTATSVTMNVRDNVTALENVTLQITCEADGIPLPRVTWTNNGNAISLGGKYTVTADDDLIISRALVEDSGTYSCEAQNIAGRDTASSVVDIKRQTKPKIHRPSTPKVIRPGDGSPVAAFIGDNVTLASDTKLTINCSASGIPNPAISWSKNGQALPDSPGYVILKGGALVIRKATAAYRGRYTCIASNLVGQDEGTSVVNIIDPQAPKISRQDKARTIPPGDDSPVNAIIGDNITALSNTTVSIKCNVTGIPKPTTTWARNGQELTGVNVYVVQKDGSLVIVKATSSERGEYTCITTNSYGQDRATSVVDTVDPVKAKIVRKDRPRVIPPGDVTMVTAIIGDNITALTLTPIVIDCLATGIPEPKVRWEKDRAPLADDAGYVIHANRSLSISRASAADRGRFSCTAFNKFGNDSAVTIVNVIDPVRPRITRPTVPSIESLDTMDPVSASVGTEVITLVATTVSLDCVVSGIPTPKVYWSKDDQRLLAGEYTVLENNTLVISNAAEEDSGLYTCTATNRLGEDSLSSNVEILEAEIPVIHRTGGTVETTEMRPVDVRIGGQVTSLSGVDITMNCTARGVPPPSIEWMNGGKMLRAKGPIFVLRNVTSLDSGKYTCVASNIAGKANASTMVNITDPILPSIVKATTDYVSSKVESVTKPVGRSIVLISGSDLALQCNVSGHPPPKVTWRRGSKPITDLPRHVVRGQFLTIFALQQADTVEYTCVASNAKGSVSASTELDVKGFTKPTIKVTNASVNNVQRIQPVRVVIGTSLSTVGNATIKVMCSASGLPQPVMSWQKDGEQITSNRKYLVSPGGTVLTILEVQFEDAGRYVCTAVNSMGSDVEAMTMAITQPPVISNVKGRFEVTDIRELLSIHTGAVVTIPRGVTISIRCMATGIPTPNITWYRIAEGSKQWQRITHKNEKIKIRKDSSLTIERTGQEDVARYVCVARNIAGSDEGVTYLNVGVAPYIPGHWLGASKFTRPRIKKKLDSLATVVRGSTLHLRCAAYGTPKPSVTWYVEGSERRSQLTVLSDGTLELKNVDFSDEGNYTCVARNSFGVTTRSTNVTVLVPPSILDKFFMDSFLAEKAELLHIKYSSITRLSIRRQTIRQAAVKRGDNLVIGCPVSGKPEPSILWLRNGLKMSNDSRHLILNGIIMIRNIRVSEGGEYFCYVKNPAGEDGGGVDLHVRQDIIGRWYISPWTECGDCYASFKGFQNRTVECTDEKNNSVPLKFCDMLRKPILRRQCRSQSCETLWIATPWAKCPVKCGESGVRTRKVKCVFYRHLKPAPGLCNPEEMPPPIKPCTVPSCDQDLCKDRLSYCGQVKARNMCRVYRKWCCETCTISGKLKRQR